MFKKTTVSKTVKLMKATFKKLSKHPERLHVSISKGNRKIGRVMNVSLPPILTCGNCKECARFCYDVKAVIQYVNVLLARVKNLVILHFDRDRYFSEIDAAMSRRKKNLCFRWHVGGEIPDYDYFCRMVENAKKHYTRYECIWTYTKMYTIVNRYCDEHGHDADCVKKYMTVMFSEWDGVPLENPYNFPVFSCKLKAGNKNHDESYFKNIYECPGNCDICKALHQGCIAGENTFAKEH